jgi:hypothetical protein
MAEKTLSERLRTIAAWVDVQQSPDAADDVEAAAAALAAKDAEIARLRRALNEARSYNGSLAANVGPSAAFRGSST